MRKLLAALLVLLAGCVFATSYARAQVDQRVRDQSAATRLGQAFTWPSDPRLADPVAAYDAISTAARQQRVNVVRTSAGFTSDDRPQVRHFAFITVSTRFYEPFILSKGRFLLPEETQAPGAFLSSDPSDQPAQRGVLSSLGNTELLMVAPLKSAYDSLPVTGSYTIESFDTATLHAFLQSLATQINRTLPNAGATPATFTGAAPQVSGANAELAPAFTAATAALLVLATLLAIYYLLFQAKSIGVMKLHGVPALRIWYRLTGRLVISTAIASAGACLLVAARLPGSTHVFVAAAAADQARWYAVVIIASLLTCTYITTVKVAAAIKNAKDTRGVHLLNTAVKTVCTVLLIVTGVSLWTQIGALNVKIAQVANWDPTRNYAIFNPSYVGDDQGEIASGRPGPTAAEVDDLYPLLNASGSLFIDSASYEPAALAASDPGTIRSLRVNPNYLKTYPLADETGRPVEVAESSTEWVLLVPTQYRPQEQEIRHYFQTGRTGGDGIEGVDDAQAAQFGGRPAARFRTQSIKILWTRTGQTLFSFNPQVFPNEGNVVTDPIVEVMTISNSLGIDRVNMITGGGNDALKVRLQGQDPATTFNALQSRLRTLRLDDNLRHLVTMDEYMLAQVAQLRTQMLISIALAALMTVALLAFEAENLALAYQAFARKILVRRLHGYGLTRSYREVLQIFAGIWVAQLLLALLASRSQLGNLALAAEQDPPPPLQVVAAALLVLLIEAGFSVLAITVIERRNLVRSLKEWF